MAGFDYKSLVNGMSPQPQSPTPLMDGLSQPSMSDQVMSGPGVQFAQSSGLQMRPIAGGLVQVINPRTGQVVYTGTAAGAANAQASNAGIKRIID